MILESQADGGVNHNKFVHSYEMCWAFVWKIFGILKGRVFDKVFMIYLVCPALNLFFFG